MSPQHLSLLPSLFSLFFKSFYFTSFILILCKLMNGDLPQVMGNDGELNIADHTGQVRVT